MKGEIGLGVLITAILGVAVITGIAQLTPTLTGAVANASTSLSSLGMGGAIGSLVLTLLVGIAIGLGLSKMAAKIFGIELGI